MLTFSTEQVRALAQALSFRLEDEPWTRIRDALGMPAAEPATKRRRLFAASRRYLRQVVDIIGVRV